MGDVMNRSRIALVGASMRIKAFVSALIKDYTSTYEVCGIMDIDDGKIKGFNDSLKSGSEINVQSLL